jgi:predicted component of type VI protein secretion system
MNIEISMGPSGSPRRLDEPETRNIVIIGDFSNQPDGNMFNLDPLQIDSYLARLQPSAILRIGDQDIELSFRQMDDFHPDKLLKRLPEYDDSAATEPESAPPSTSEIRADSGDDMFERLLGKPKSSAAATSPAVKSTMDRLLAEAMSGENEAPSASATVHPGKDAWSTAVLRQALTSPSLKHLESNWRSLAWLGEQLDYDEETGLWVVDADTADVKGLAERLPGQVAAGPGSAHSIVVLRKFGDTDEDRQALTDLSKLAATLNAKAFAAAAPDAAGLSGKLDSPVGLDGGDFSAAVSDEWGDTRLASSSVCLGFPAFLLRQPYGKSSDPIDSFDFEELPGDADWDAFAWGNAGLPLLVMHYLGEFSLGDFPMVMFEQAGGQAIKPPSGVYITDSASDVLLSRGITPLLSKRGDTGLYVQTLLFGK